MTPDYLSQDELVALMEDMLARVKAGDSFEGSLTYLMPREGDADGFDVTAVYRIGNSMGQGGMRMVGSMMEPTDRTSDQRVADAEYGMMCLAEDLEKANAKLKYLRAAAHLFPHVNTDRETHTKIGLDDAEGVWCLGCTVAATTDEFDRELLDGDDDDEMMSNALAHQWMREYEARDR